MGATVERNFSMRAFQVLLAVLVLAVSVTALSASGRDEHVVLVMSSRAAQPGQFAASELRRLFLGMPVFRDGDKVVPLLNASNKEVYQAFLQKVMFMSEANYQRQLVLRVFRRGGNRPAIYHKTEHLVQAMEAIPNGVSFMLQSEVEHLNDVEVVQPLW